MLEILILIALGKRIANKAKAKGRSGTGYVFLLLGFWFGGEIFGALLAGIFAALAMPNRPEDPMLLIYLAALVCAALGAFAAFKIVDTLPDLSPGYTGEWDDSEYRPRRSRDDDPDTDGRFAEDSDRRRPPHGDERIKE